MREIRTSGLMSGEGKRAIGNPSSHRALPRLYSCRADATPRYRKMPMRRTAIYIASDDRAHIATA